MKKKDLSGKKYHIIKINLNFLKIKIGKKRIYILLNFYQKIKIKKI